MKVSSIKRAFFVIVIPAIFSSVVYVGYVNYQHQMKTLRYLSFSLGCQQAGNPLDYCRQQALQYVTNLTIIK
jgi:hypothetical protein